MITVVTTQEELDAAIERGAEDIVINSSPSVRLQLRGSARVEARGYSRVDVRGPSITVDAWDYSHVAASRWVTVYRRSARATITGGIIIDMPFSALRDPAAWVAYHGVATKDGVAVVHKAVSQELVAGQGRILTTYTIGSTVEAAGWDPDPVCGHGLHFSPTPSHALLYYQGHGEPRYLACEVDVASLVPFGNKCKAPSCRVLHEVNQFGDPVAAAHAAEQETTP